MPESDIIYNVSEFVSLANSILEENFAAVWIEAEVSELSSPKSGHLYFTLKDETAQLSCAMWAQYVRGLDFIVKVGAKVRCLGRPSIYPKSGRFQVVVVKMQQVGQGDLQKKYLELKAKLEAEGLFLADRKRAIPFFPKVIGVVTSESGAVIHDIMVRIKERMPSTAVLLYDVRVQGDGAAKEIAHAINYFNKQKNVEVIIVARGGGSLEDLWPFNEELVVRAIFASLIPVVSGVGHEVDVTLSDLVADLRAPTPTAAAEMVIPDRRELAFRVDQLKRRLLDYSRWLMPLTQELDELEGRLFLRIEQLIKQSQLMLQAKIRELSLIEPKHLINNLNLKISEFAKALSVHNLKNRIIAERNLLDQKQQRLKNALQSMISNKVGLIERSEAALEALNPKEVLERGFCFMTVSDQVIKSVNQITIGQSVSIKMADGHIDSTVDKIETTHTLP